MASGLNHIFMADHVSFRDSSGTDGFVEVASLSQLNPDIGVMINIYLLLATVTGGAAIGEHGQDCTGADDLWCGIG